MSIKQLKAAIELAEHRAAMWADMAYAGPGNISLDEFYECDEDEAETMARMTAKIVEDARAALEATAKYCDRYAHPEVMSADMIHNAMDIWECVILTAELNDTDNLYQWFTQQGGRNEGVEIAMTMAPRFEAAWDLVKDNMDGRPFDFEFVPPLIDKLFEECGECDLPIYEVHQTVLNRMALQIVDELPEVLS